MHASKGHWGHAVNDDLTCCFFMTNATTFLILINGIFFVSDYTTGMKKYQHFYKDFVSIVIKIERQYLYLYEDLSS